MAVDNSIIKFPHRFIYKWAQLSRRTKKSFFLFFISISTRSITLKRWNTKKWKKDCSLMFLNVKIPWKEWKLNFWSIKRKENLDDKKEKARLNFWWNFADTRVNIDTAWYARNTSKDSRLLVNNLRSWTLWIKVGRLNFDWCLG